MAYFDNNSTTKPGSEVREAYDQAMAESWRNPSSPSQSGAEVRVRLDLARESIARSLEVDKESVTFTSGSTEANNAVFAHAARCFEPSARALVSSIEHPSVLAPADHWFSKRVQTFPVEPTGVIDLERISALLDGDSEVRLVSLMAANNETGVLQPWRSWPIFAENGEFTFIAMPLSGSVNFHLPGCRRVLLLVLAPTNSVGPKVSESSSVIRPDLLFWAGARRVGGAAEPKIIRVSRP